METGDAVSIPLQGGSRIILHGDELAIYDATGRLMIRIAIRDITSISRGGRDIHVVRREADPLVVTAASIADAQRLLDALRQQHATPPRDSWWKRHRPRRLDT